MLGDADRLHLLHLLRTQALLHGNFVLSSGQRSSYYLDARLVTLSSAGSPLVGRVFFDQLQRFPVNAVAGLSVGADPIVASIAVVAGLAGYHMDGLIVRKERKEHGAGRRIEGPWRKGLRVAIVDDTLTTGASCLAAVEAVCAEGGSVEVIYCLIDREQGARQAVEEAGYRFESLFTAAEIVCSGD